MTHLTKAQETRFWWIFGIVVVSSMAFLQWLSGDWWLTLTMSLCFLFIVGLTLLSKTKWWRDL